MTRVLPSICLLLLALPLAAGRQHAVSDLTEVTITGVVRDVSGTPLAGTVVFSGTSRDVTGANGKYTLTLPENRLTLITAEDFAFEPVVTVFTPVKDATLDFNLTTPGPAVTVKLTSGESHALAFGTSQFAYLIPFSGYARFDNANFCKTDGSTFAPAKTEISRIIGPAISVNFSACCTRGPVMTLNVEMKSGEKAQVYFNDSCFGNEVDFLGRERSSREWLYFNFTNVAEIDFP